MLTNTHSIDKQFNLPSFPKDIESVIRLLIDNNKLSMQDIEQALGLYEVDGSSRLFSFFIKLGLISEIDLLNAQVEALHLASLPENEFPDYPVENNYLSNKFLKNNYLLPIEENENQIFLVMADATDTFSVQSVELACEKTAHIKVATVSQIDNAISRLYEEGQSSLAGIAEEIENNNDINLNEVNSVEKLKNLAGEAPVVRLVNLIISRAIEARASDIHIEPFENHLKIRYRIDGVLQNTESPPARSIAAVISRIKIMAKLNIAERRLPQDGRIQLRNQGKIIDLRVSTVPTLYGESLVLRVLDKQRVQLDLKALGFEKEIQKQLLDILTMPHGIVLVTGPTGSGKTTTLYAALQNLNTPEKKILTVEDPVEYQLEGINQIQVKPQIGLTFADALRSIVRQDPDVIMIGEMRDLDTARIAVQSALTGHLVLSTLHTNDAGSSITRLMDMGVEDYLLTSTLNGILAQRLIRSLCTCKESFVPPVQLIEELTLTKYKTDSFLLHKSTGCEKCGNTGYIGRSIIMELLCLTESIRRLILSHADSTKIQQAAIDSSMLTMKDDGIKKALQGITTIEEVIRVTQNA